MDLIILCGGKGTRIESISKGSQKCMLPIGNKPFIELVIQHYLKLGNIERIFLAAGYRSEEFDLGMLENTFGIKTFISIENEPLGTGGSLKYLMKSFQLSKLCIVVNGDSLCGVSADDIQKVLDLQSSWDLVIGTSYVDEADRYGKIILSDNCYVRSFEEKKANSGPGLINSGFYVFCSDLLVSTLNLFTSSFISLEKDIFPIYLRDNRIYGLLLPGFFIDIGIPSDFHKAQLLLA